MADDLRQVLRFTTARKLVGHESVAQIVDLGSFNSCGSEESVDGGSDVSDKKRAAGLGNK